MDSERSVAGSRVCSGAGDSRWDDVRRAWLGWPPFIFEHLAVLLVVVIAVPYGVGPAIVAAATSVVADNVLLREPIGRPTITGYRDVLDLLPVTVFVAGDDAAAKHQIEQMARDIACDAVDAGPLQNARLLEPVGYFNIQLGYVLGLRTDIGLKLVRA